MTVTDPRTMRNRAEGPRWLGPALGRLSGCGLEQAPSPRGRAVDATLGEVMSGLYERPRRPGDVVLVNPFGMAIEDVMMAHHVYKVARRLGLGQELPR